MSFFKDFKSYDGCTAPGVLLPEISIDERYYNDLGVATDLSNYDFLTELCRQGAQKHGSR